MQEDATLLDILIDGFEKNEILWGFHHRDLPMPDEMAAVRKFTALVDEARRWKGEPVRLLDGEVRRLVAWPDLEIRQAGRGIVVRVRSPWFNEWWSKAKTWHGDPMDLIYDWVNEDSGL